MFFELKASDKTALVTPDGLSLTYAQLKEYVDRTAGQLPPRELVFVLCENTPASVIGYLACLNARCVPLLLDKRIDRELLHHLLEVYRPAFLAAPAQMEEELADYKSGYRYMHYAVYEAKSPVKAELYPELALLLTTSGSTGSPKLVRQSYQNIQSNAEQIAQYLELTDDERPITTLPMNYTYGLSIINSHLLVGATILMTDQSMGMKPFWDYLKKEEATSFGGVPFTYEMLKKIRFFKMDLPSLRYMTQAGGKLSPDLHREFAEWAAERGKKFIVMYGACEATARMGYLPAERSIEKYGSMGFAIPGGKFLLLDGKEEEITKPGEVGELVYVGPNVTLGYAQERKDLALGDERGGRLVTGDMARFDDEGFYYVVGRKKRFLKIFGNRVNLDDIDMLIKKTFPGLDCASSGVDDHMRTFITDSALIDEVRQYLSATTHLSETAFEVNYIEQIPKNDAGKVLYNALPGQQ